MFSVKINILIANGIETDNAFFGIFAFFTSNNKKREAAGGALVLRSSICRVEKKCTNCGKDCVFSRFSASSKRRRLLPPSG